MCHLCTYMNHKDYDRSKKKNNKNTHGPILSYAKDLTLFHIGLPDFNK